MLIISNNISYEQWSLDRQGGLSFANLHVERSINLSYKSNWKILGSIVHVPIINNLLNYENERFCIKLRDEHDEKKKFFIPI